MNRTKHNSEVVQFIAGELDIPFEFITPYHMRITHHDGRKLDYFPKSGRATWVASQKWFTIKDIEKYMYETFKEQPTGN